MYLLLLTVYELGEDDEVRAELYRGQTEDEQPLATAHMRRKSAPTGTDLRHDVILEHFRAVCDELAENWAEPLF